MVIELWIQYICIVVALFAFFIDRHGMKRYLPVGLFASLYANGWCYLANYFNWWEFPLRLVPVIQDISFSANVIAVPILVMFWIRYSPLPRVWWALLWSALLTATEYVCENYTSLITYHNGYNWYHSFLLWLISWAIWLWFHKWFYKDGWRPE